MFPFNSVLGKPVGSLGPMLLFHFLFQSIPYYLGGLLSHDFILFRVFQTTKGNYTSFLFFFGLYRAAPVAYGHSQARGHIGAVAVSLHHSHSNTRSERCL